MPAPRTGVRRNEGYRSRGPISRPSSSFQRVYLSTASAWEIAIKRNTGKLAFAGSLLETAESHGFTWCEITARDAA